MGATQTAGYSGTPLAKKLGIKEASKVCLINAPDHLPGLLAPLPASVTFTKQAATDVAVTHVFVTEKSELAKQLAALRHTIAPTAMVWISWPKKASKVATTVTEDVIRELALPIGFVDVKVCAIDETWSGLKLVIRKQLR